MLVHYLRGDATRTSTAFATSRCSLTPLVAVPAHLIGAPVRSYPLRPTNEPRLYVAGERIGQRVPQAGPSSLPPYIARTCGACGTSQRHGYKHNLGLGIGGMSQAAALAQQNQAMDALERERRRGLAAAAGSTRTHGPSLHCSLGLD